MQHTQSLNLQFCSKNKAQKRREIRDLFMLHFSVNVPGNSVISPSDMMIKKKRRKRLENMSFKCECRAAHKRLQSLMEKGTSNIMSDIAQTHAMNVTRLLSIVYGME